MRSNEQRIERIKKRNERVVKEFDRLKNIKDNGIQRYSYEWMLAKLAQQYYLSTFTIESIIKAK